MTNGMMTMLAVLPLSLGFVVQQPIATWTRAPRAGRVVLCAAGDGASKLKAASIRVVEAAASFGDSQGQAAANWVADALAGAKDDGTVLLEQQLSLFEECLIDDEDGKCKELDSALTAFEGALAEAPEAGSTKTKLRVLQSKKDRAGARVRAAAAKFGPAQKSFAADWTKSALDAGEASDSLMEQTLLLFDQCQVTADGKADPKCVALYRIRDSNSSWLL